MIAAIFNSLIDPSKSKQLFILAANNFFKQNLLWDFYVKFVTEKLVSDFLSRSSMK